MSPPNSAPAATAVPLTAVQPAPQPAYRRILPLRTRNIPGDTILIDGVSPDHKATDILAALSP